MCVPFTDIVCNTNVEIMRQSDVRYVALACNHKNKLSSKNTVCFTDLGKLNLLMVFRF